MSAFPVSLCCKSVDHQLDEVRKHLLVVSTGPFRLSDGRFGPRFADVSATFSSYSLFFYFSLLYKILTKSEPRMWPPLSFSRLMKVYASFCEKLSDFSPQVRGIYIPTLHICRFCCSVVSSTVCDCNFFFSFWLFW